MLKKIFILSGVLVLLLQMPLCAAEQNNITADSNTGNILHLNNMYNIHQMLILIF